MVSLRIALRYLFSKKSHNAVNVISVISMMGVAVATAAIVCVLSVFNGFSDLAFDRLSKIDPDLRLTPVRGKTIGHADSMARVLAGVPGVDAAMPVVQEHALAIFDGTQMAVRLLGVPDGYSRITDIDHIMIDGDYMSGDSEGGYATLSVGTALRLGARPDSFSPLNLYVPRRKGRINPSNPMAAFRTETLCVGGVYQVDDGDKDARTVMAPISAVRNLLDYTTEASAIDMKVAEGSDVSRVAASVCAVAGADFRVMDRLEQESESFRMISVEKWITFVMLAFILVIASFNVISTLSMLIIEKRANMATLRAMGADMSMVRRIFLWEGWLISVVGGLTGIVLGVSLCLAQQLGGFIKLGGDPSQLSVSVYPVRADVYDLLAVALLVMVTGLIVGLVTSRFVSDKDA